MFQAENPGGTSLVCTTALMKSWLWPVKHYRKLIQCCCFVMWSCCTFALSQPWLDIFVIMHWAQETSLDIHVHRFMSNPLCFLFLFDFHSWVIFSSSSHPLSSFLNSLQLSSFASPLCCCLAPLSPAREPTPAGGQHALGAGERRLGTRTS